MLDDDDSNPRDQNGRWKKGYCPNPKGRPRKKPENSDSDVHWFKEGRVDVVINGEKRNLSRHQLLMHAMFEQATKGRSVLLMRKLMDRFEQSDETMAEARFLIRQMTEAYDKLPSQLTDRAAKLGNKIVELIDMVNYGQRRPTRRKPRITRRVDFRNGQPKSKALLALEAEERAELEAERSERERDDETDEA